MIRLGLQSGEGGTGVQCVMVIHDHLCHLLTTVGVIAIVIIKMYI